MNGNTWKVLLAIGAAIGISVGVSWALYSSTAASVVSKDTFEVYTDSVTRDIVDIKTDIRAMRRLLESQQQKGE